jgi:photosynthetic reaction center cytochrome c subunit
MEGHDMNVGKKRTILTAGITLAWLVGVGLSASGTSSATTPPAGRSAVVPVAGGHAFGFSPAGGPQAPGSIVVDKPQMAEEVFKNVQVLKGIPIDVFMQTMGIMSSAISQDCAGCHVAAGTQYVKWDADTPRKVTARRMVTMMTAINKDHFNGRQVVTCWTCHRGRDKPVLTVALDYVYGTPNLEADDVLIPTIGGPTVDQILDKYIAAVGGAQKLAAVTTYVATATSVGFGGFGGGGKVTVSAKFPDQRATQIRFDDPERGDSDRVFDGKAGWIATPLAVVREYPQVEAELEGSRLDAQLSFPQQIKKILTNLHVADPQSINDRDVQVIQGNGALGLFATLYFDKQTGFLVRMVRYTRSPIGRVPTQVDYSDYREVGGIKMPFSWTFAWLDGRDSFKINDVKLNVPIDAAVFGRPNPLAKKNK